MNAVAGDPLCVWMALTHDAGKLTTPRALWPHHYGHEVRGERLAIIWGKQLNLPEAFIRAGSLIARLHMKAGRYTLLRPGTRYDLLMEIEKSSYTSAFWKIVDIDTNSHISQYAKFDWESIQNVNCYNLTPEALRQQQIYSIQYSEEGYQKVLL